MCSIPSDRQNDVGVGGVLAIRHHHARAIDAQPLIRLAGIDVAGHDDVEQDREQHDHGDDEGHVAQQREHVAARLAQAQEVGELRRKELHATPGRPSRCMPITRS